MLELTTAFGTMNLKSLFFTPKYDNPLIFNFLHRSLTLSIPFWGVGDDSPVTICENLLNLSKASLLFSPLLIVSKLALKTAGNRHAQIAP